jgi:hypothetical protein
VKKNTTQICEDNQSVDEALLIDPEILNAELDEELAEALEANKSDLEILELQHDQLEKKQSNLLDMIKKNAGDLLASKMIVDELLAHKKWIEDILNKNLEDMRIFEKTESLVVTTFELDQPKLKKFLDILNKMFLFEQKIKGFRDTLITLNRESQSFGEDKIKVLETYEEKLADFHVVLENTANEIKQRHKAFQKTKELCESLDGLINRTKVQGHVEVDPLKEILAQANKNNQATKVGESSIN